MHSQVSKKYKQNQSGFTLVEAFVSVVILLVVTTLPITIAVNGLKNAAFADERITAVYLAQEAIESIERLRDENALAVLYDDDVIDSWEWANTSASDPLKLCISNNGSKLCEYDSLSPDIYIDCSDTNTNNNCLLQFDSANAPFYIHSGIPGTPPNSPFTRTIDIKKSVGINPESVKITVKVEWKSKLFSGNTRDVELTTWLYDHYSRYEP